MFHSFDTAHAEKFGIEAAIVINHLQFWIRKNAANGKHQHEGRTWTYNSARAYDELFPYFPKGSARRTIDKLREKGVLVAGNFNQNAHDRTLWYAFADEAAFEIHSSILPNASQPNEGMHSNENGVCIPTPDANASPRKEGIHFANLPNGFDESAKSLYSTVTDQISNHSSPKKPKAEKSESRIPTTENALRFHKAYNRQENTAWSAKEIDAFKALGNVSFEDVDLVCRYTEAEKAKGKDERGELRGFHRRDLITLLNNFAGELDKARDRYAARTSAKPAPTVLEDPPHWQQWHDETGKIFAHFRDSRNYQKEWFTDWKKEKGYN